MWTGAGGPPNPKLLAREAYMEMIQTAQKLATRYEISREEIDAFALRSHRRAATARDSGRLAKEIVAVEVPGGRRQPPRRFEHDEGIRDDTTLERLAALTAQPGTARDDRGQLQSALRRRQRRHPGERRARATTRPGAAGPGAWRRRRSAWIPRSWGSPRRTRCPRRSPRPASQPDDVDVYEIHEAFAAQVLAVLREFETQTGFAIPDERLNPNGGAVALGHPFGDSGTRGVLTLATELAERGARYGCLGICVGSGQGVAIVLERP